MMKIKLYKNTQTRAYMMDELFTGQWALDPYYSASPEYEGHVDEEAEFVLPDGYEVAEDKTGGLQIYKGPECCYLQTGKEGEPWIVSNDYPWGLKLHQTEIGTAAAAMGHKGGSIKSKTKAAAVRENGKKGGRPRKTGKIEGTKKAGEGANVVVADSGQVIVTWNNGEKVTFVSEAAFDAWVGGGKWAAANPYIKSVTWQ
jgi:hypothetical protein